jgi:hypothetical protein
VFIFNRALTDAEITSMHAWISEWEKLQPDCLAEIIIAAVMKIDSRFLY